MTIYAIFLCFLNGQAASCHPVEPPRISMGYAIQGTAYPTLAACESAISRYVVTDPVKGRYYFGPGEWYECEHRHVDTWEGR